MIRRLVLILLLLASLPLAAGPTVDKVLVHKHERRLELLSGDQVVRSYRIALGRQPIGHKQQRGDQRTPEGIYTLDWRQHSEQFNLSIHIDYPNLKDRISAMQRGVDPGSMIMIHGTPIDEEFPEWYFKGLDWTNGCIALQNDDMRELWKLVPDGTLIEIRP
ncbi:MAG: L,D-transpeptidase family protein [Halopseudomonas yangmingensis]|uniref:L,D-transpeptidase catalytic domain n=1 Tax=Halopseudomonas yangmingensis TaxID=1720063 RepID=A0A1I4RD15_9GAMM|nr:L,D-transpeptidase family protein [Halopseudomonas yangmingensis]SFM50164.1 L,D-transpeptidase catalytic domain [Halopseudomonas yangmingensis]